MPQTEITHIFFDAGGTLLGTNTDTQHWYEQFFVDVCAEQGCSVTIQQVHEALNHAQRTRTFERRCSTPGQTREFWEHIYSTAFAHLIPSCNHTALASHYIDRFETGEYVQLFPDTLPALQQLRSTGVRMGVVSNFGTYLNTFLEKTGIADFFDFVVVSAAEGCEKPHPDIFDIALARSGAEPAQVLFVGDHPREDYEAALRHGYSAILIDRHNRHADKPDLRRIQALTELVGLAGTFERCEIG